METSSESLVESESVDFGEVNEYLATLPAAERIEWAVSRYGEGLYLLSSMGTDSVLAIDHVYNLKANVPVLHINTGFLYKETLDFRDQLKARYGFRLYEFGPGKVEVNGILDEKLWETDLEEYGRITKLNPMSKAIDNLGITALLTGVRADQTDNRATLDIVGVGNDGEIRINPFIDWSAAEVAEYIDGNHLPRNPKFYEGYESVGDWHTTKAGAGRIGRTVIECGLHVVGGKLVRQNG